MIEPELLAKLNEISAKVDRAVVAAEKARTYLFWTGVISLALIVLPAIALVFVIPSFLSSYTGMINGLGI